MREARFDWVATVLADMVEFAKATHLDATALALHSALEISQNEVNRKFGGIRVAARTNFNIVIAPIADSDAIVRRDNGTQLRLVSGGGRPVQQAQGVARQGG